MMAAFSSRRHAPHPPLRLLRGEGQRQCQLQFRQEPLQNYRSGCPSPVLPYIDMPEQMRQQSVNESHPGNGTSKGAPSPSHFILQAVAAPAPPQRHSPSLVQTPQQAGALKVCQSLLSRQEVRRGATACTGVGASEGMAVRRGALVHQAAEPAAAAAAKAGAPLSPVCRSHHAVRRLC